MLVGALALLAFGLLVVLAPLIWAALVHFAPAMRPLEREVTYARLAIAAGLLLAALIIIHKFLPAGRRTLVEIAPGIALTLALWIETGYGFGIYLSGFARNYTNVYAGLASVMTVLVFLYWLAAIFIYGAELNSAIILARRKQRESRAKHAALH